MAITSQTMKIDLRPGRTLPVLYVSQNDSNLETLHFELYEATQPFQIPERVTNIYIYGCKESGEVFSLPCTWNGNTVSVDVTSVMTDTAGAVICELSLQVGLQSILGTGNFIIKVEKSPFVQAHVSTSSFAQITEALNTIQKYYMLSKSWAVGNTGVRTGENTNNSEFWCEQARIASYGGEYDEPTETMAFSAHPINEEVTNG